jgi:hypothetical protein
VHSTSLRRVLDEPSTKTLRSLDEPSTPDKEVGSRKEEVGEEEEEDLATAVAVEGERPADLQRLWNEAAHPALPRWEEMNEDRRKKAKARLRERPLFGERSWAHVIAKLNASAFCRGDLADWRASPDWLLRPGTAAKVLDGNYDDGQGPAPPRRGGFDPNGGILRAR